MMRPLPSILAVLSLVICVAACVLWVRSFFVADLFGWLGPGSAFVRSEGGLLAIHLSGPGESEGPGWRHESWERVGDHSPWRRLGGGAGRFGFLYAVGGTAEGRALHQIVVPCYAVALAAAVAPAAWATRRLRRRNASHVCRSCGYDLRATPETCPECGTMASEGAET